MRPPRLQGAHENIPAIFIVGDEGLFALRLLAEGS
jgi:hypothetical protein